jgi:hypothetical protein
MTFSEISLASEIWFHTLDSGSGDCSSPWEGTQVWFGPVNEFNMQNPSTIITLVFPFLDSKMVKWQSPAV